MPIYIYIYLLLILLLLYNIYILLLYIIYFSMFALLLIGFISCTLLSRCDNKQVAGPHFLLILLLPCCATETSLRLNYRTISLPVVTGSPTPASPTSASPTSASSTSASPTTAALTVVNPTSGAKTYSLCS